MVNISNLFEPLIDSLFQVAKVLFTKRLPNFIDYQIDNNIYVNDMYIPIGRNIRDTQYLKIGGENAHTYIVGNTGSGKSTLLKVILTTIVNNYPNVQLYLFDYKRVELSLFREAKNTIQYLWDTDDISKALEQLYQLVLDRFDILASKCLTIADNSMNSILVVCEEISLMSKTDMKILRKIMAISRAVKVYVLFTTQRPSNDTIDNTVKSLVSNRICLKTEDTKNSIIALDMQGCEQLKGKGHGYIKSNGYTTEFQSYYISDTVVNDIVSKCSKPTFKEYQNKAIAKDLRPIDNENDKLFNNTDWLNRL